MLNWSYETLLRKNKQGTKFSEILDLTEVLAERTKNMIQRAHGLEVTGELRVVRGYLRVKAHVKGEIVVPSTRSLTPVTLPLDFKIDEAYTSEEPSPDVEEVLLEEELLVLDNDQVDIQKAVEDHVILQVPTQVLTEAERLEKQMPSGNEWEVMTEEAYEAQQEEHKNNPFAGLNRIFDRD